MQNSKNPQSQNKENRITISSKMAKEKQEGNTVHRTMERKKERKKEREKEKKEGKKESK